MAEQIFYQTFNVRFFDASRVSAPRHHNRSALKRKGALRDQPVLQVLVAHMKSTSRVVAYQLFEFKHGAIPTMRIVVNN
jgi:hypothetical protein